MSLKKEFSVFAFLHEEQLNDVEPAQQHVHCTKRIRQLRRALGLITLPKAYRKGSQEAYKDIQDCRYLKLILLEGQRDLARHRELKASIESKRINAISKGNIAHRRKRLSSLRILKATRQFSHLADILSNSDEFSSLSYLEMKGYLITLKGLYELDLRHWEQALSLFSAARTIYTSLQRQAGTVIVEILKLELSSLIDPALHWCAHEMQLDRGIELQEISTTYFPSDLEDTRALLESLEPNTCAELNATSGVCSTKASKSVTWRGFNAKIKDSVASNAIVVAEGLELDSFELLKDISMDMNSVCGSFDRVLAAWQDVVDVIANLRSQSELYNDDPDEGLQILFTFSSFHLISNRMIRDRLLLRERMQILKSSKNNQQKQSDESLKETHRLCMALTQSTKQICDLPGVARDEKLCNDLAILTMFWKSQSLFFMSKLRFTKDKKNALTLAKAADEKMKGIRVGSEASELFSWLLFQQSDIDVARLRTISWLYTVISMTRLMSSPIGSNSQDVAQSSSNAGNPGPLQTKTTALSPIAVKPVFFDVAYNHIDFPRHSVLLSTDRPKSAKRGFFGIFSR